MSDTPIEVVQILDVTKHPNAERLAIVKVLGTQFIAGLNDFRVGDACVYFPPDMCIDPSTVPPIVLKYLKKGNRVGAVRLRGEPSFGFGLHTDAPIGTDLTKAFGGIKWNPPEYKGEGFLDPPGVFIYTSIQHCYKFPGIFNGQNIVVTEKIHGTNCRLGVCKGEFFAGSHRRIRNMDSIYGGVFPIAETYLEECKRLGHNVTVYGELYGAGVQFMDYGVARGFRAFDIMVNGCYLNFEDFRATCLKYNIPMVPILYCGAYYDSLITELVDGPAFQPSTCQFKGREGVVIKTIEEKRHPRLGRMILKAVSADYYASRK